LDYLDELINQKLYIMLKNILELKGIQTLTKPQQQSINGGGPSSCVIACRQDFGDCREDRRPNCTAILVACRAAC
jgi:hypothetical protein